MFSCREKADLLSLVLMFPCVFVTFPYVVSGQVWYLIDSIPDLCLRPYFIREGQHYHNIIDVAIQQLRSKHKIPLKYIMAHQILNVLDQGVH